jgi:hypothetical protein
MRAARARHAATIRSDAPPNTAPSSPSATLRLAVAIGVPGHVGGWLIARAACPDCGTVAGPVHETALARPRDVCRGSDPVRAWWVKRRWKCQDGRCDRKPGATGPRVDDRLRPHQIAGCKEAQTRTGVDRASRGRRGEARRPRWRGGGRPAPPGPDRGGGTPPAGRGGPGPGAGPPPGAEAGIPRIALAALGR